MEVENSSDSRARQIALKKHEAEMEDQRLQADVVRAQRDREKQLTAEREKTDKAMVAISKEANQQVEASRKLNSDRVHAYNENAQKHHEELAAHVADELQKQDADAMKLINDRKASTMEKVRSVTEQAEDPFYRAKTLAPVLSENDQHYTVQVRLPEHEAKNVFVSAEGSYLKLALTRRYQDNVKDEEKKSTSRTNSFQSIVEQLALPGPYDAKKIDRVFKDGVLTIKVPKQKFEIPPEKA